MDGGSLRTTTPRARGRAGWRVGSDQSRPLGSREELEQRFDQYDSKFDGEDIPLPPFWGGFTIRADRVEYWEGRPSRMHERVVLTRSEEGWNLGRLYP